MIAPEASGIGLLQAGPEGLKLIHGDAEVIASSIVGGVLALAGHLSNDLVDLSGNQETPVGKQRECPVRIPMKSPGDTDLKPPGVPISKRAPFQSQIARDGVVS